MTTSGAPTLSALLERADHRPDEWRRQLRAAIWPLLIAALFGALWSALAPLAGAVVAPGEVKLELNRKIIQHAEGGIVREILVRDGQRVRAGEALLRVADLRGQAELALIEEQWRAARMRAARAEAEVRGRGDFQLPTDVASEANAIEHYERERAVFDAHLRAAQEQRALLLDQLAQTLAQAAALESQLKSTGTSARLSDEDLAMNEKLVAEGFISRARLIGLQRIAADYSTRMGEHRAELAGARQRAAELRGRIAQIDQQRRLQATDEMRDAAARVRESVERLRPSLDQVERQTVRAPVDGTVMSLRVASTGAVVAPREALLEVIPANERLVVSARIATHDIEHLHIGASAELRLLGGDVRRRQPLRGRVSFVSPDRLSDDRNARSWYEATIEVDRAELMRHDPQLALVPGMPVEVYVTTGARSLFEYFAKPFGLFAHRALREP